MKNFTLTPDPDQNNRVNKKIQKDINYICGHVKKLLGQNLYALLLCGGFGRGEGSVTITEKKIHIVNDYDFTVVLNASNKLHYLWLYKKYHQPLEMLSQQLAANLSIKQVDLSPKPMSYFEESNLKIENYEVKKGHVLVYGQDNPTRFMPDWQSSDIPLFEGTWLFRNRGLGLILAALYWITTQKVASKNKENFIIECTKAQMAMGDAALLIVKKYHHLYHQRLNIARNHTFSHIPNSQEVKQRYTHALTQKLRPNFSQYETQNLPALWYDIRTSFLSFFKFFEQHRLDQHFTTWTDYVDLPRPEDKTNFKAVASKLIRSARSGITPKFFETTLQKSKPSFSINIVALTLAAIDRNGFNKKTMRKAAELLKLEMTDNMKNDWIALAVAVLNEIHPGGEAGKIIGGYHQKYK